MKGKIAVGQYADVVILSDDYFTVPDNKIKKIHALVTIVNGKVVYAEADYKNLCPTIPEVIPSWSPVKYFGGYQTQ